MPPAIEPAGPHGSPARHMISGATHLLHNIYYSRRHLDLLRGTAPPGLHAPSLRQTRTISTHRHTQIPTTPLPRAPPTHPPPTQTHTGVDDASRQNHSIPTTSPPANTTPQTPTPPLHPPALPSAIYPLYGKKAQCVRRKVAGRRTASASISASTIAAASSSAQQSQTRSVSSETHTVISGV